MYNPNDPYNNRYNGQQNCNPGPSQAWYNNDAFADGPGGKNRGVAGLLAIFLGSLGIQYFYMGKTTPGIVCLLVTVLSCGTLGSIIAVLALVQGILMLCMSNQEFEAKYIGPTSSSFPIF